MVFTAMGQITKISSLILHILLFTEISKVSTVSTGKLNVDVVTNSHGSHSNRFEQEDNRTNRIEKCVQVEHG